MNWEGTLHVLIQNVTILELLQDLLDSVICHYDLPSRMKGLLGMVLADNLQILVKLIFGNHFS